ncbi:hypothetical protein PsalN5692_00387 [Piscirickettsia salmonis]|nr:hypothetical protein PsalN5692_00387 [Piscirickettsia salmonis]
MPKFHQSFYISFLANNSSDLLFGASPIEKSFFSQKDKDLSRQYTIDMYTQQRSVSVATSVGILHIQ